MSLHRESQVYVGTLGALRACMNACAPPGVPLPPGHPASYTYMGMHKKLRTQAVAAVKELYRLTLRLSGTAICIDVDLAKFGANCLYFVAGLLTVLKLSMVLLKHFTKSLPIQLL